MNLVYVSDISSLNFRTDWKLPFQQNVDFVSQFLPTDPIQIQYIILDYSINVYLENRSTGEIKQLSATLLEEGIDYKYYNLLIDNTQVVADTCFTLFFATAPDTEPILSSEFEVCMELPGTVLLKYTNRRNEKGAIFSGVDPFYFRVNAVFLPQENSFESESEDFRDQRFNKKILSSHSYEKKTLTIGPNFGVPNWVGRKINIIFSLSSVWVDGNFMVCSGEDSIATNILGNDYPRYIYKIVLEDSEEEVIEEETSEIQFARAVDEKKKIIRKASELDIRVYSESDGGSVYADNALMIRQLEKVKELTANYMFEVDNGSSGSSERLELKMFLEYLSKKYWDKEELKYLEGYLYHLDEKINSGYSDNSGKWDDNEFSDFINQPVRTTDNVQFRDILGRIITITDGFMTDDFVAGMLGEGVGVVNKSEVHADKVLVRKYLEVLALVVQKMYWRGGMQVLSPAGMKISRLEEFGDYWRCYMETEDGQTNDFTIGAQARCNAFGDVQKYYWRLVVGIGSDYIDLSKTDCDVGSASPQIGDDVVQIGHRTDPNLQWAVIDSCFSADAGRTIYAGVNSYSLSDKWVLREGVGPKDPNRIGLFTRHGEFSDIIEGLGTDIKNAQTSADSAQDTANSAQTAVNTVKNIVDNLTGIIIPDLQNQVDGAIQSWDGEVEPTLNNYPANEWKDDAERSKHVGDTYIYYTKDAEGKTVSSRYNFRLVNGTYKWEKIADSVSAELEKDLRELTGTVGKKNSITYSNNVPTPPYNIDDLWIKEDKTIYICKTQKLEGMSSDQADWTVVNDAMLRLKNIADDNIITKEEKTTLRDTWSQIQKEFAKYQTQATTYAVPITTLQNAYNALNTFLTNTVKISQNTDTSITVAQKTQYNQLFADYYAARTDFANLIADKLAEGAIGNLQIGSVNLISKKMMLKWNEKNKDIAVWGRDVSGIYLDVAPGLLYNITTEEHNPIFDIVFKPKTQYVFSIEWKHKYSDADNTGLAFYIEYNDGTRSNVFLTKDIKTKTITSLISEAGKTISKIYSGYGNGNYNALIYNISLIEGNKPLQGFPVAEEDAIGSSVNLADGTKEFTVTANATSNYVYKPIAIRIKPNTVYHVQAENIENLVGSPEKYSFVLYNKAIDYALVIEYGHFDKNGGILITKNDFEEQDGYLLCYAGIAGATAGNSVKYTEVMIVEGFYPAAVWTPSAGDVNKEITEAQKAADDAQSAIALMNDDSIFDIKEKQAIRTQWENINGTANTTGTGTTGSYSKTKSLATGLSVSALDTAYTALRTYLNGLALYTNSNTPNFARATMAAKFTAYYDAEIALTHSIADKLAKDAAKTVQVTANSQTFKYGYGYSGTPVPSSIVLTATARNFTPSSYQWQYLNGSTWTNISGATAATYTVAPSNTTLFPSGTNLRTFRCICNGDSSLSDLFTLAKLADGATGATGAAGKDAYTVLLTNEAHTFAGSTSAALAASTTCQVIAYKGTAQVAATIGTITGMPTGMSVALSNNGSTSAGFTVSVTTSMTTKSGILTVPVTVDGKSFTLNFSYALALKGATGSAGISYWRGEGWLDASAYDENKWIPFTGTILPNVGYRRICVSVQLNSGKKPSWSTHSRGFSVDLDFDMQASGWGTTQAQTLIYADTFNFCSVSPASCGQMTYSSTPVLYLRGGGRYYVKTDFPCTWTPRPDGYTWTSGEYSQTVSPQTSRPKPVGTSIIGRGIKSVANKYAVSSSNTTAPTSWSDTVPSTTTTNKYLWNYEIITYTDNTTAETSKRVIGVHGATGVGIKSITEYYLATTASSGVTTSTSGWTTGMQVTTTEKKYLWNYEIVIYTDGNRYTSTPVIIGTHGATGAAGNGVKSSAITYQASASGTTAPTGTWGATIPSVAAGQYLWTRTIITYTDNTTSTMYSVGKIGTNGTNGNAGNGVSSTTVTYQASTSGTVAPTGTWSATIPSVAAGSYLWTKTVISYTNGSSSTIYSVGKMGETGAVGESINGVMKYKDPMFKSGVNGTGRYAAQNNGGVTAWERILKSSDTNAAGSPYTESAYCMRLTASGGTTTNHLGGFTFTTQSRANAVFFVKISAKIPVGYTITHNYNQYGTGGSTSSLTSRAGTGKYETYLFKIKCGYTGTFSTICFFSLSGPIKTADDPLRWYVDYATVFDESADGYADVAFTAKDEFAQNIGYNSLQDMLDKAKANGPLVNAGLINSELINTAALIADNAFISSLKTKIITAKSITADKLSVAGFVFADNKIYGGADFGSGAGVKITSTTSEKSFKAYKDSSNYVSMYYNSASDWGLKGFVGGNSVLQLGVINKIGGFEIGTNRIGVADTNMGTNGFSLYGSFIKFKNANMFAAIGTSVFPSSSARPTCGRFENTETRGATESINNTAIYLNASGCPETYSDVGKNLAIDIGNGHIRMGGKSVILGFGLNVRVISSSTTLTAADDIIIVTTSSNITITLPDTRSGVKKGKMLWIRKCGSGNITLSGTMMVKWNSTTSSDRIINGALQVLIWAGSYWTSNFLSGNW